MSTSLFSPQSIPRLEIPTDALLVEGGAPISGTVRISGAKNAVLPMMAAAILAPGVSSIHNVPALRDVSTMALVLQALGIPSDRHDEILTIDTGNCRSLRAPYELVKTMRASIYVLGPLLALHGRAEVSLPGGCAWGPRPVDIHLKGMEALGARVELDGGYIVAEATRLRGAEIELPFPSVVAAGNHLMAAVLAEGTTALVNAAREPEIGALAEFLIAMGARISGAGSSRIEIEGVTSLAPTEFEVIPDRIEAGTYLIAGAMAGGAVRVVDCRPDHLEALLACLRAMEVPCGIGEDWIEVEGGERPAPLAVKTAPFPGLATDLQAQLMALAVRARGTSSLRETVYPDRFKHVSELVRLGARIQVENGTALIEGVEELSGAPVMASDLRASAALVLAGLVARGTTRVGRVYHIDRGYSGIEQKLAGLGARIRRVRE